MEHIIAALFTIGFLGTHPHPQPQPAAPRVEKVALHVATQPAATRLQHRDERILAINTWMRELRGGHLHPVVTPATVAQRAHLPNS